MSVHVLPFGRAGWDEKVRILRELIGSRPAPPFRYNDVLILVPSSRMRRAYGRLFLDLAESVHGTSALVQPEVHTLHQFLQRFGSRTGGPRLIDENSRLVLLEGIVKERITGTSAFGGQPDILAPSLSAAVADMIEELSFAGIRPERLSATVARTDFSDKPQVKLLADAYAAYERILKEKGLTDPAGMVSSLAERFDPAWLSPYSRIIIDGLHDANDLQARFLLKIAASAGCAFLVEAPSSEDIRRAGEHHPLRLVREFLARVGVMPGHAQTASGPDDLFLAGALFSEKPFADVAQKAPPSFRKDIRALSAVNMREEVSLIAGFVKRSLAAGALPDAILVAFPSLDEYGPLTEEIFNDCGIPFNRALGRQLSASAVATAVVSLLKAAQEDFSGPSLLRVLSSPFLKFHDNPALAPALDRLMRDRRVIGGRQKLLAAIRYHATETSGLQSPRSPLYQRGAEGGFDPGPAPDILTGPLQDLFTALEPFSEKGPASLLRWMDRLAGLIAWAGLPARVSTLKGPLNMNLQAYRKLNETMISLSRAGRLFPEYRYTFSEWLFLLKKTFMHARFQVPPEDEGGVQVLGLEESAGRAWSEIYLGGLIDGRFPRRMPQNIFLPEATLEALGVRTLEKARLNAAYHFYRLLLSAEKVTLTCPENVGDKPVAPSPFLEELTPLRMAGLVNRGIEKTSGLQFSLKIEDSRSVPELAKAIAMAGSVAGLDEIFESGIEGIAAVRSAYDFIPVQPSPAIPSPAGRRFSVTELDLYLRCPYDYLVTQVMRVRPLEEATEDISPLDRGSKVHDILRGFYQDWKGPVTTANRDRAGQLLRSLAERHFEFEADTFRNRKEKERFLSVMAVRFLDAEEEFWKQGFRPAYLEHRIERFKMALSDGTEVAIEGKIDRIDVDEHGNFIIVDYKTGGYPLPRMNIEQDIFQLPVYAVMAQQSLSGKDPALKKPIGLAYYDLAGKTGGGARDVVLYDKEARDDHPAARPKASPKSRGEFKAILTQSMDKARKAVEGILKGDFASVPQDASKCRFCPNEMMCERDDNV